MAAVCVYCSSSNTIEPAYFEAARDLGAALAVRGDTLVYGGASVGLMGEVARTAGANGGRVIGIIPQSLFDVEIAYHAADELIVTKDMRERKGLMDARADAFIALPGGLGTLEEIFEIMTLKQIGTLAHKPLVLLNIEGFYDPLVTLLETMRAANFVRARYRNYFHLASDVQAAFDYMDEYDPERR